MTPVSNFFVCVGILLLKIAFLSILTWPFLFLDKKKLMKLILSMWKKTAFNPDWKCSESHPHLALWIDDTKGEPNKAHGKGFNVVLNLSNMLRQTLTRHTSKSIKHQNWIKTKLKSVPVTSFFHGMFNQKISTKVHHHFGNQT